MSKRIVKRVNTNPITGTRHIRYDKPMDERYIDSLRVGLPLTIAAIAGFVGILDVATKGHDENYEEACARRDAQPKKSVKPELIVLGIAGITFIALMAYIIAMAFIG